MKKRRFLKNHRKRKNPIQKRRKHPRLKKVIKIKNNHYLKKRKKEEMIKNHQKKKKRKR